MIILVFGEKGGTGKSTLAQHVAVYCSRYIGRSVALVDVDVQGTSMNWSHRRKKRGVNDILTVSVPDGNGDKIRDLNRRHDVVIVDVGGRDTKGMRSAMVVADVLVAPFQSTINDLDTLVKMKNIVDTVRTRFNPKVRVCSVLSKYQDATGRQVERNAKARGLMEKYGFPPILGGTPLDTDSYDDAARMGATVLELPDAAESRTEMVSICKQIMVMAGVNK